MEQQELAYDLRQKYAEIVGVHLERVTNARIEKNYPAYFEALEDLFTIVKHKFKKKKTTDDEEEDYELTYTQNKKDNKKIKRSDLDRYYELRQFAINRSNEYESTFLGNTKDPNEVALVEKSLREVEMFLFYVMDKARMFGSGGYVGGL